MSNGRTFLLWKKKLESKKKEIKETVKKWLDEANRAIEKDYEKRLDEWKQAKAAYPAQYAAAAAKQSELQEKIAQLEQEKAQLKGFFTGKKKKEMEGNIAVLRNSLTEIEMPQDPGEPPIRGELLNRDDFNRDVNTNKNQEKIRVAAAVFPNYRQKRLILEELVENLKEASVGEKVYFGTYPYGKNGGRQNIQWRVLEKRENSLLLLTEYGIDAKKYHENEEYITWRIVR